MAQRLPSPAGPPRTVPTRRLAVAVASVGLLLTSAGPATALPAPLPLGAAALPASLTRAPLIGAQLGATVAGAHAGYAATHHQRATAMKQVVQQSRTQEPVIHQPSKAARAAVRSTPITQKPVVHRPTKKPLPQKPVVHQPTKKPLPQKSVVRRAPVAAKAPVAPTASSPSLTPAPQTSRSGYIRSLGARYGITIHPYDHPQAPGRWGVTSYPNCQVWVGSSTPTSRILDVVKHEYGHVLQCRKGTWWSTSGTEREQIADAVALQLGAGWTKYTANPTPAERSAAAALLGR